MVLNVKNLRTFQLFLKLCAGYASQMININAISIDIGVDNKTIKHWFLVLESSFIIYFLQPHHRNFNKRLVKTPKLYFYDTGILCYLLGVKAPENLRTFHNRGALFENLIVTELIETRMNHNERTDDIYFWRNNTGNEVDIVFEEKNKISAIEIKSGRIINQDFFKGIKYFEELSGSSFGFGYLIYGGNQQ